jgi:hypothetical protein
MIESKNFHKKSTIQLPAILVSIVVISFLFFGCEKEIDVELPDVESRIVVDGQIENGKAPIVLLTRSQGYFEPTDLQALQDIFIQGAKVSVKHNGQTDTLVEVCSSSLPPQLLEQLSEQTGFSPEALQQIDICGYTSFTFVGETNTVYDLKVEVGEEVLTSSTKINNLVELDSLWFEIAGEADSLGFLWAEITDPDTLGNAYRWFAKRINDYPAWSENAGEQKDQSYIAPIGSAYDDQFYNGLSFEFAYYRGVATNSGKPDDQNEERGYYKLGDTVAVRGCHIDRGVFRFVQSFETNVSQAGSPFASPANVDSNIEGGLGVWAGYAAAYDTVVCVPQ